MPTYVVTDPKSGRKVKLTGDSPPTDADLDEIFASLPAVQKLSNSEIESLYPYPEKPESARPSMRGGSGMAQSGRIASYKDQVAEVDRIRELARTNPEQAALIAEMTPTEKTLVGLGAGLTDVRRWMAALDEKITPSGWPISPISAPPESTGISELTQVSPAAAGGRVVGQALPFLPGGLMAGGLRAGGTVIIPEASGIFGAAARQAVVGGAEGGIISAGTGGDAEKGALVGATVSGGLEAIVPVLGRVAGALIRRVKGSAPSAPPIDANLNPSPELQQVLDESGMTMDDLIEESGVKDLAQETAAAATSGAEGRISDLASKIELNPARVAAAEREGVQAPIAVLTDQSPVQEIVGAASAVPGSKTSEELVRFSKELTKRAEDFVEKSSGYLDKEVVSESLKGSMQKQIKDLSDQSSAIYRQIDSAVPADTIVNAKALRAEIARRGAKSQKGVGGLTKVEQDVFSTIQGKPTYFDIDRLRKDIGASIGKVEGTYTNEQTAVLKDMYSKLTQLQEGVADQVGVGAGDLWRQAKELDKARFAIQENSEFLFGKNNVGSIMPKLESSLAMLAKGNNKNFNEIVGSIPEKQRPAVISGALDSILRKSYAGDVRLDANGFAKWYNQLGRSQSNKSALMSELPEGAEKRLDDLYLLAQGLSNVTNNRVRTGVVNSIFKNFEESDGLVAKLYNISEKAAETPIIGAALGPTGRIIASTAKMAAKEKTPVIEAADNLLASPEFRTAVLSMDLPAKKRAAAMKKLESTDSYKKYISSQSKARAAQIASVGLIPFLVSEEEEAK